MIHVLYEVFQAASFPVLACSVICRVFYVRGRMSARRYYGTECFVDAYFLVWAALVVRPQYTVWGTFLAAVSAMFFHWDIRKYREHRDDDDDWGKRLKSWARSHIPRPTIVQLRPQAGEAR